MKAKTHLFNILTLFFMLIGLQHSLSAKTCQHEIELQLADFLGVPVENTQFKVTVDIVKREDEVTLHFPPINFQVGQCSKINPACSSAAPAFGYIITASGYLPEDCRPAGNIPVSVMANSGNGLAETSSFTSNPPPVPTGYSVQVYNTGDIQIQGVGNDNNWITTGSQIVLPCSISYLAAKPEVICENFKLSKGKINVTEFTGATPHGTPAGDNIRDSHINDAFDNLVVWAWADNHKVSPTANILNLYVRVGEVDKEGKLKLRKPIQVTNLPPNIIVWDTAVAINRKDKNNIVISYSTIEYDFEHTYFDGNIKQSLNCRAVSFDGGKTWGGVYDGLTPLPYNGPLNYQPPGGHGSGDYPGVKTDKFGNFWLGTTNFSDSKGNLVNVPYLLISTDQGVTWDFAYTFPPVLNPQPPAGPGGTLGDQYDYPHLTFGGNGSGKYGLWYYADYIVQADIIGDLYPAVAFIPITGPGKYGKAETTFLNVFPNTIGTPTIAAANDGRFWALGNSNFSDNLYDGPLVTLFKSPGAITQNYAGPWLYGFANEIASDLGIYPFASIPLFGMFTPTVEGLIYDEKRNALYGMFTARTPELSQNMRLYFAISRNNGQTWSRPYDISTTAFANRGFNSMALDEKNGDLYLGWYDGRNSKDSKKLQYFGGVIKAHTLNKLTKEIPLSDPLLVIPNQGFKKPPG